MARAHGARMAFDGQGGVVAGCLGKTANYRGEGWFTRGFLARPLGVRSQFRRV
jgi:hypothetical protein